MTEHFGRAWIIELGDVKVSSTDGHGRSNRCTFEIERDDSPIPNRAKVAIYNLSPDTRANLKSGGEDLPCRIQAGYRDNYQEIFNGQMRRGFVKTEGGKDIAFHASAGEGNEKIRTAKINKSWPKDTDWKDVVADIVKSFGFSTIQDASKDALTGVLARGISIQGDSSHELTELLMSFGCRWYVNGEVIVFVKADELLDDAQLKIETFISAPEIALVKDKQTKTKISVVKFTTILEPSLYPGVGVALGGEDFEGNLQLKSTKHVGDTHGTPWYVECEGKEL